MNQFNGAPEQGKETWRQPVERYIKGFSDFAERSRELNKGVTFTTGDLPEALKELRSRLSENDRIMIQSI